MGDVVFLQVYKEAKVEEKARIRATYMLNKKIENTKQVLSVIEKADDVSLLAKSYNLSTGIVNREVLLEENVQQIIKNALIEEIKKLNIELQEYMMFRGGENENN